MITLIVWFLFLYVALLMDKRQWTNSEHGIPLDKWKAGEIC